jgi:hypothetical protein
MVRISECPTAAKGTPVTFLVTLVVPANLFGQVVVEAISEQEAARIALASVSGIDWKAPTIGRGERVEVFDVEPYGVELEGEHKTNEPY